MICIAKYKTLQEAQKKAFFLQSNGIQVDIVYAGDGSIVFGTGTFVELMIAPEYRSKLEQFSKTDLKEEIESHPRSHKRLSLIAISIFALGMVSLVFASTPTANKIVDEVVVNEAQQQKLILETLKTNKHFIQIYGSDVSIVNFKNSLGTIMGGMTTYFSTCEVMSRSQSSEKVEVIWQPSYRGGNVQAFSGPSTNHERILLE